MIQKYRRWDTKTYTRLESLKSLIGRTIPALLESDAVGASSGHKKKNTIPATARNWSLVASVEWGHLKMSSWNYNPLGHHILISRLPIEKSQDISQSDISQSYQWDKHKGNASVAKH